MRFIARSLQAKGQTDQARDWYLRAIAEAPHLREPYVELAQLLYTQKRWEGVVYIGRVRAGYRRTAGYVYLRGLGLGQFAL